MVLIGENYGFKLLHQLAEAVVIKGLTAPELSRCRQFYQCYPQILGSLTQEFKKVLPDSIFGSPTQVSASIIHSNKLKLPENYYTELIGKVSFTHFVELIKINTKLKPAFGWFLLVLGIFILVKEVLL